jgi:hypothetical protein
VNLLEGYLVYHSDFGLQEDGEAKANIGIKTAPNKILKLKSLFSSLPTHLI